MSENNNGNNIVTLQLTVPALMKLFEGDPDVVIHLRKSVKEGKRMRNIDSKFHIEAQIIDTMVGEKINIHIVKTSNGDPIPEDEPLFLLRARDYIALPLLHKYREMCIQDGCTEYQAAGNDKMILEFEKFASEHRDLMKQPGITRGL